MYIWTSKNSCGYKNHGKSLYIRNFPLFCLIPASTPPTVPTAPQHPSKITECLQRVFSSCWRSLFSPTLSSLKITEKGCFSGKHLIKTPAMPWWFEPDLSARRASWYLARSKDNWQYYFSPILIFNHRTSKGSSAFLNFNHQRALPHLTAHDMFTRSIIHSNIFYLLWFRKHFDFWNP